MVYTHDLKSCTERFEGSSPSPGTMGLFYTRKGDKGLSHIGKTKVSKTCLEVEVLGQLDELNSIIGVLKSQKVSKELENILHQIQENLFIIQAQVANIMMGGKFKTPEFKNLKITEVEKIIDRIENKLKPARGFVISGTNQTSSWLDFLRAKSRNVERSVLKMGKKVEKLSPGIKAYLNRLSSLLFALARWEARGKKEKNPKYK